VPGLPPGTIPTPRHPPTPQGPHRGNASDSDARTQREPTGAPRGPRPLLSEADDTARAWGQAQAAAAPRWSAAKRARMARSFGLTLPEYTDDHWNPPTPH
jgi:hypothetical protein